MITMDLKGVAWVGNLYQKFEAMCLEVEDIMYQDTVRYVDNQVQSVGASVKRFYSDIMQDLSPSSIDPLKVAAADLPLEHYADIGIYKKPKTDVKKVIVKADMEQVTEDMNVIPNMTKGDAMSFNEFFYVNYSSSLSSEESVKGECSNLNLGKHNDGVMHKEPNVGIEENYINEKPPPSEFSGVVTLVANDLSNKSSLCDLVYENHQVACDQAGIVSPPDSVEIDPEDEGKIGTEISESAHRTADVSNDHPSTDMIYLIDSTGNKGVEARVSSSGGLLAESNGTPTNYGVVSVVGSSKNGFAQYAKPAEEISRSRLGQSEDWNIDTIDGFTESGMEAVEPLDKGELEETCVVVDADKAYFVSQRVGKHRSYKKKIRDAFSTKTKSTRKHEYEQLAVWHEDVHTGSDQQNVGSLRPSLAVESEAQKFLAHDICESEWELL